MKNEVSHVNNTLRYEKNFQHPTKYYEVVKFWMFCTHGVSLRSMAEQFADYCVELRSILGERRKDREQEIEGLNISLTLF